MKRLIRASSDFLNAEEIASILDDSGQRFKIYVNGWKEGKNYACRLLSNAGATVDDMNALLDGYEITKGNNTFYLEV